MAVDRYKPVRIISTLAAEQVPATPSYMPPENHLALSFNDISTPISGMKAVMPHDIERLINFTNDWKENEPILIHCWMGISRSTATAFSLCNYFHSEISEMDWAKLLRQASPSATPNSRIVSLMDAAMNREGRLIKAAKSIGRGEYASLGNMFTLKNI